MMAAVTNNNSLIKAVYQGRLRLTRLLLEGGAYINESNELGETPLIIACKSKNTDNQGVPRAKMIAYLLESGADPNIQDKSGKTALMHACLVQAGPEVVSLLLSSGADPCLEDHSGLSTLIHAINCSDEITLKLLMDSFKARGKEVIIITTERLACGRLMAKQYLKVPPMTEEQMSCASPSEIHLSTSPQETLSSSPTEDMFSFHELQIMASSQKSSSVYQSPLVNRRVNKFQRLQRLHSEPWLKIPQSFLAQNQAQNNWPVEDLPDITPEEQNAFRMDTLAFGSPLLRHCSADLKGATCLIQTQLQENYTTSDDKGLKPDRVLSRNMSFDGLSSIHSLSHPNLNSKESTEFTTPESGPDKTLPDLAVSSLCKIIQRRKLGLDYYGSDSQLSVSGDYPGECKRQSEKTQLVTSLASTLASSREPFEINAQKIPSVNPEINKSEAFQTDSLFNPRPSFLPPLNHQSPVPSASSNKPTCGLVSVIKQYLPSAPPGLPKTRRMLMRRHSMQTEQMKQLW
ncbi:ankyrin repeat domain-containing protein 34B [Trichomycterus rosablanca]|uniref:ankyrin repeat domain-containing protein 34B n=1 Tax=Trichomycterus rosablanca TaxID=2290929 RepID=UPI002F35B2F9